jgi:hypothetical protein
MNQELEKGLAEFLVLLTNTMREGLDAARDQFPSVVQEYLRWALVSDLLAAVAFGVMTFLVVRFALRNWANYDAELPCMLAVIAGAIFAILGVVSAFDALKVWLAPRVYALDWLWGFLK